MGTRALLQFIQETLCPLLGTQSNILVYCTAGEGRSGMFVEALQRYLEKKDAHQSIRMINKRYVERNSQKVYLEALSGALAASKIIVEEDRMRQLGHMGVSEDISIDIVTALMDLWAYNWTYPGYEMCYVPEFSNFKVDPENTFEAYEQKAKQSHTNYKTILQEMEKMGICTAKVEDLSWSKKSLDIFATVEAAIEIKRDD